MAIFKKGYFVKKILFYLAFSSLCLLMASPFERYDGVLLKVDRATGEVKDSDSLVIGSSGVVIHKFDEEKKSIIAKATVIKKENGIATLKFGVFDMLAQDALPLPGILPAVNDEIILNFLYNRALIIAPNKEIFTEITKHFTDIEWIHPDIVAANLSSNYKPNPNRSDFKNICHENSTRLVFFALNKRGHFVDCESFKILKSYESGEIAKYMLPFYSRVDEIESAFWKFDSSKIDNFDKHYGRMLVK